MNRVNCIEWCFSDMLRTCALDNHQFIPRRVHSIADWTSGLPKTLPSAVCYGPLWLFTWQRDRAPIEWIHGLIHSISDALTRFIMLFILRVHVLNKTLLNMDFYYTDSKSYSTTDPHELLIHMNNSWLAESVFAVCGIVQDFCNRSVCSMHFAPCLLS